MTPATKSKKRKKGEEEEEGTKSKRRSREKGRENESTKEKRRSPDHSSRSRPGAGVLMGRHSTCHPACRFPNTHVVSLTHCMVSVVQRRPLLASQGDESNDVPSLELPSDDAPECRYGAKCYRKNPQHRKQFKHPPSFDVIVEDMSTNGTYINENLIGRGNTRTLRHGDELSLVLRAYDRAMAVPDSKVPFEVIAYRYTHEPTSP